MSECREGQAWPAAAPLAPQQVLGIREAQQSETALEHCGDFKSLVQKISLSSWQATLLNRVELSDKVIMQKCFVSLES